MTSGSTTSRPTSRSSATARPGRSGSLRCDFIAGCDGFHGVSRSAIPAGAITTYEREYPFSWLGILAEARPASDELVYSAHERGFALLSMRSPTISRLYLQVANGEDLAAWPDDRIWTELRTRMATDAGWELADGPIIDRSIAPMRGFVTEPMQFGRLYLAGDAAHIVPATGAKGLNLAVSDVNALAEGIAAWYAAGRMDLLDGYSARCLKRVWRVQDFSWYMSSITHVLPGEDGFGFRLRRAELEWLVSSTRRRRGASPRTTSGCRSPERPAQARIAFTIASTCAFSGTTTSVLTMPNIPLAPSACGRMWQWNAHTPGVVALIRTS